MVGAIVLISGKARQLHRRCRHRGVHPASHRGGGHSAESPGAGADEPGGGLPEAGRRRDSRELPWRRARTRARLSLARGHRSSEDPARDFPRCSSASSPAPGGATGCPASSACAQHSTSSSPGSRSVRPRRASSASSTSWCIPRSCGTWHCAPPHDWRRTGSSALAEAGRGGHGCSTAPRPDVRSCIAWRGSSCCRRPEGTTRRPLAALDTVRVSLSSGMEAGLAYEALRFGELAVTDVSRNLVGIFFATTALKKDDGVPPGTVGTLAHGGAHRRGRRRVHGRGNRGNGGAQRRSRSAHARRRPAARRQGDQDRDRHPRRAPQAEATHPSRAPAARGARLRLGR